MRITIALALALVACSGKDGDSASPTDPGTTTSTGTTTVPENLPPTADAGAEQVVDAGTLRGAPYALTWGRDLLEPPDRTLNQQHRAALELRGTPYRAGQHALEFDEQETRRR